MARLRDIHSFWIGPELPPLAQMCLASFVAAGHRVVLHAYEPLTGPAGVEVVDAADVLPADAVFRHERSGGLSMFADLFRYRMLQKHDGVIWVDTDVYCLRPFDFAADYVFGVERTRFRDDSISNAILAAPAGSELLTRLVGLFETPVRAARYERLPQQRLRFYALWALGIRFPISRMSRHVAGPPALTHLVDRLDLRRHALPLPAFFEDQGPRLFQPGTASLLEDPDRYAVHFCAATVPDGLTPAADSAFQACAQRAGPGGQAISDRPRSPARRQSHR